MKNNLKKKSLLLITIMLFSSFSLTALAATTAEGSYTTTMSPYVQGRSLTNFEVHVNENNEIYGSEYFLEQHNIHPDLISAIGDNGVEGYVKAIDLEEPMPDTLEEAIEYQNNISSERTINLYKNDGITVIGTYTVEYGNMTYEVAE